MKDPAHLLALLVEPVGLGVVEVLFAGGVVEAAELVDDGLVVLGPGVPGQVGEQLVEPGEDLGVGLAVGARLGDGELEELGEAGPFQDDPCLVVVVVQDERSEVVRGQLGEQGRRLPEAVDRGRGVVDAGGEGLVDDVG